MKPDILDLAVLEELEQTVGAEFLQELVVTFLEEGPAMIGDLQAAVDAGENEAIQRAAHSLKSNANTFGAVALAEMTRSIELEGIGDAPAARIDAVSQAFAAAAQALSARQNA